MKHRTFGTTGLDVSEIGFGGSRLGGILSGANSREGIAVLRAALDAGINFYDTADMYSQGEGESLLGKAFDGRRDQVIIASKVGYELPRQRQLAARIKPLLRPLVQLLGIKRKNLPAGLSGTLSQDFSPEYLTRAVEGSLQRLKTDYLDIYQLHSPPKSVIEQGDFIDTMEELKRQGKIRYYGVAADSVEDAALCLRYSQIHSLQAPFGLLDLDGAAAFFAEAHARGIGVISRGCFGGGLLKETLTESELKELTPKWERILKLRRLAKQSNRSVLEMALQFCLRAPSISVTILGMRTEQHVRENLEFCNAKPLTDEELALCSSLYNSAG